MKARAISILTGAILVLGACGGAGEPEAAGNGEGADPTRPPSPLEDSPLPESTAGGTDGGGDGEPTQWQQCLGPGGVTVAYPQDWHTNEGGTILACSAFDPEPLDAQSAKGFIDSAILVSVQPVDFAAAADSGALPGEAINRSETGIDGHDAVRIETRSQEAEGAEQSRRTTRWLVVLGRKETLSLVAHEAGNTENYESYRRVLDEMVSRLELPDN